MAANSFLNHLQDLDFTNEEQDMVFTPTIQWDSSNEDSDLLVIAKMISFKPIDDNAVVRDFQGIWKKENVLSITIVKPNYFRIKFPTEDIKNDILSWGLWTLKDEWLALAAFKPNYNIDEYTFFSINMWVRIYGIPSIHMDNDDTAHHTRNSLGAMIGKVDTSRIDFNMVDYLRVGILDVSKPVRRCIANGVDPTDSIPPFEGNIGPMQVQPPNQQFETNITTNGSVQFKVSKLVAASSSHPPIIASTQAPATSPHPPIMVSKMNAVTSTHPPSMASNLAIARSTHLPSMASKLAAATSTLPPVGVCPKTNHQMILIIHFVYQFQ
ncbi:hypothetical protein V6N13_113992 [Hibiscus sabdariffa]